MDKIGESQVSISSGTLDLFKNIEATDGEFHTSKKIKERDNPDYIN